MSKWPGDLTAAGSSAAIFSPAGTCDDSTAPMPPAEVPQPTRDMAQMAVAHAARLANQVPAEQAVSARPLRRSLIGIGVAALATLLLAVLLPGLAQTAWLRFSDPYADVPPFARTEFEVEPGDTRVRYGDGLDIYAKPIGAPVERLELVLSPVSEEATETETLPMFPEPDGRWRAVLAKVTAPAEYYVRAHQARSRKFKIDVQSVPEIEKVEVKVVPPAYTADATYVGPVPKDGIAGLPARRSSLKSRAIARWPAVRCSSSSPTGPPAAFR